MTIAATALILAGLAGCDSGTSGDPGPSPETLVADAIAGADSSTDPTAIETRDPNAIDIGDVEQAIHVVGRVSKISQADNIVENIIQDRRDRIRTVAVEVNPPNPASLWIGVRMDVSRSFDTRPVVLDTKVLVDGGTVDTFTLLLWKDAHKNQFQRDVDVLFGLSEIPETMLVTMESEALLLPEGTDLTVTDPYSVSDGQRTKAISSAPIRIDFKAPGPKPAAETPAAPAESTSNPS